MSRSSGGSSDRPVTPQSLTTYDVPPSRSSPQLPPSRPPRPAHAAPHNEYQNLPTNSHAFPLDLNSVPTPPRAVPAADPPQLFDSYDFPKPQNGTPGDKRESNINIVPSPPKACSVARGNKHSYINAATGYVPDNAYLDMAGETSHDPTYTDMTPTPPVPLPRPPETLPSNDLYVSPPAARPVVVRSSVGTPRGMSVAVQPQGQENAMNNIWSTHRTKSFKRNQNGTRSSQPPISTVVPRVGVHSKSPAMHLPHRDGDVSSDDEGRQPIQRVPGVQSVPPPPPPEEKELKYLDLDLEESSDKESIKVKNSTSLANSTPTEYREIDFVKTEALSNTKKWGDDQRQLEKQASS